MVHEIGNRTLASDLAARLSGVVAWIATALTFVISTLTTYAGVKALDPDGEKLFYSLGASRWQVFRKLVVPFCLPWIISVLRVNIGLALTGAIVGEFIASQHGLADTYIEAAVEAVREELGPLSNLYTPAAYKRELARALVRRALLALREA